MVAALEKEGFAFVVTGSFAVSTSGELNDVDLVIPPDDAEVSRTLQWLEGDGFSIESWNGRVTPPVSTMAFAHRHYFRARRTDARGVSLQVDVNVAANRATFDAYVLHEEPRKPSREGA